MKTVSFDRYGGIEVLHLSEVDKPRSKKNEVLVKIYASSLNDWDTGMSLGLPLFMRLFTGWFKPKVEYQYPGCDVAGVVESIGEDVTQLKIGDRVYGDQCISGFSTFAEYVCVPEDTLTPIPKDMTYEQAACLPQAGQLAVQGLIDTGHLQPGQKLLINGAGGGAGTVGVQIAKDIGCEITVVDKASKLDMLLALGAHHAIDYEERDFCKLDEQYDLIFDTRTTRSPFSHNKALKKGGQYVTVGGSMIRYLQALLLNPVVSRISGRNHRLVTQKPNKDLPMLSEMFESGKLIPVIDSVHDLDDFKTAYEIFYSAKQKGNVVICMNQNTN